MKQIVISIVGALLILRAVKIILPDGTVKKYASFIVSVSVVLILTVSVLGSRISLPTGFSYSENREYSEKFEEVRLGQVEREFSRQLDTDMKRSIPELKNAELRFSFDISEDNTGYVTHMIIKSAEAEDENVKKRISEAYMIPSEVIEWRRI